MRFLDDDSYLNDTDFSISEDDYYDDRSEKRDSAMDVPIMIGVICCCFCIIFLLTTIVVAVFASWGDGDTGFFGSGSGGNASSGDGRLGGGNRRTFFPSLSDNSKTDDDNDQTQGSGGAKSENTKNGGGEPGDTPVIPPPQAPAPDEPDEPDHDEPPGQESPEEHTPGNPEEKTNDKCCANCPSCHNDYGCQIRTCKCCEDTENGCCCFLRYFFVPSHLCFGRDGPCTCSCCFQKPDDIKWPGWDNWDKTKCCSCAYLCGGKRTLKKVKGQSDPQKSRACYNCCCNSFWSTVIWGVMLAPVYAIMMSSGSVKSAFGNPTERTMMRSFLNLLPSRSLMKYHHTEDGPVYQGIVKDGSQVTDTNTIVTGDVSHDFGNRIADDITGSLLTPDDMNVLHAAGYERVMNPVHDNFVGHCMDAVAIFIGFWLIFAVLCGIFCCTGCWSQCGCKYGHCGCASDEKCWQK